MPKLIADKNNKQVFTQLNDLNDRTRMGIRRFWFSLGKTLTKSFNKAVLAKPRSGRVYKVRRGKVTRRHTASLPGETPANLSGNYRKSIGYQIRGTMEMQFGNRAEYAGFLENGTSRMAERPGLGNAVDDTEGEALQDASNILERELTRR